MSKWEQQGGVGALGNYRKNHFKIWGHGKLELNICKLLIFEKAV